MAPDRKPKRTRGQRVVLADIPGKNRREKKQALRAMQKAWVGARRLERAK